METLLFNILERVDSTNNYAMARVHEGLAIHGQAWFAHCQEKGKGQRGKVWESNPNENLILSIVVRPPKGFEISKFHFHALSSMAVTTFLEEECGCSFRIKWPNDIYFGDRKAGGILIENTLQGPEWKWAVLGFGINVNQVIFPENLPNPVSLKSISQKTFDTVSLARRLHFVIMEKVDSSYTTFNRSELLADYNNKLYMRGEKARLRAGSKVFEPIVKMVDEYGNLVVDNGLETSFAHGEVEWLI